MVASPAQAVFGSSVTVTYLVRNVADIPAQATWADKVYLSADDKYDSVSDTELASVAGPAFPFAPGGFFANVLDIAPGPEEYGFFQVHWSDGVTVSVIQASPNKLSFTRGNGPELGATTTVDPWWRIRPREDGKAILAETSTDGHNWTTFAIDPVTAPVSGRPEIQFGAFAPDTRTTIARVASVDVCPD